jgi:uncharacterized protein (DUF885 family)
VIVDTGLHGFGWSKDKAVEFIVDNTPANLESAITQVSPVC